MAIAMGSGEAQPMSDINTTPLVDVMLVLVIIFLIAVPVAIQTVEGLEIPVIENRESDDKVENLLITVTTTDAEGRTPRTLRSGFTGATRDGECRVFFNNTTLVDSTELYDAAFERLDAIVQRAGGPEAIMADPELIPQVHIRGDVDAPWRCVAGTIFNVQAAGYPTIAFISNPIDPNQ
ncbi:biopolymer transporter ExbD [Aurantiacibacter atlanticus]|uniref:Biopolymer transporter ExbD n=1 Tax=Aurantiacibacter atlanticus TaxID=1648404 RepID=A0A0H4VFG1_9SPHN|nr:biopolymer transporter ExbD [Aurantiacibacter atlanticus]AKQ43095.2 biopolymer transporter ExbD [Aurantiacibacter atlanticus]MDF1835226.1 biopolymer transporter ExbD [Alteraurantiacibacter sp. bin_em_oilr2.035]